MNLINGHKTQIGATLSLIVGLAIARGWLDSQTGQVILGVVAVWTGAAIAHSEVKKAGK
jgi:hypothetical protein